MAAKIHQIGKRHLIRIAKSIMNKYPAAAGASSPAHFPIFYTSHFSKSLKNAIEIHAKK